MSLLGRLEARQCPVCDAPICKATPHLEQSIDIARINDASFASRKTPELMSYRMVRCSLCATIYAAEAPAPAILAALYRDADYDSAEEAAMAAATYEAALGPALSQLRRRARLLEIGAGTGVFLDRIAGAGFTERTGIEPSRSAIDAASPSVKSLIREGVFNPADFAANSVSTICCFQTLEHVADPRALAEAAFRLLEPGGLFAVVTHDVTALINRLLGRRSPIIDIEHLQLFCPASLRYLLGGAGFSRIGIVPIKNTYPLRYWLRLAPLPMKPQLLAAIDAVGIANLHVSVNVGNILTTAWKPEA
jgi:SAM-dependent methyltransferase